MAQYKVIQDIEAEDKLIGPLTLRQFIYAGIVVVQLFIAYKLIGSLHSFYVIIPFIPGVIFFGLLAAPFGTDQPNEIWLLAKIRYFLKPQLRKWHQDDVAGLVTITVPKKVEKNLTKDFSKTEAKNKLESLARLIDSRGWAVKNLNLGSNTQNRTYNNDEGDNDRLVDINALTNISSQIANGIVDQDDIFDTTNLQARYINSVIDKSEKKLKDHQKQLVKNEVTSSAPAEEPPILDLPKETYAKSHHAQQPKLPFRPITNHATNKMDSASPDKDKMTTQNVNAKINMLSRDNNRSVASISHEINGDEVVISLH
ncbi:MAG TPA: PrgI family protein [Candidatus Saccharimonadia bacterium]|nr:PrgI family protein [Candidatus Saccharimonadia bacterium]